MCVRAVWAENDQVCTVPYYHFSANQDLYLILVQDLRAIFEKDLHRFASFLHPKYLNAYIQSMYLCKYMQTFSTP
jgi:hypothetical protein